MSCREVLVGGVVLVVVLTGCSPKSAQVAPAAAYASQATPAHAPILDEVGYINFNACPVIWRVMENSPHNFDLQFKCAADPADAWQNRIFGPFGGGFDTKEGALRQMHEDIHPMPPPEPKQVWP